VRVDELGEVFRCRLAQLNARQLGELVEWNRFSRPRLLQPELRPFECAIDAVEQFDDVVGVGIGVVKRARQERPRKCSLMDVCPLGESGELRSVLRVERYVQTVFVGGHRHIVHE
jgi:hypothetical protein